MNLNFIIKRILREEFQDKNQNILGGKLEMCSRNPLTGYYRDGYCRTDENDKGSHTVCAKVNQEFLDFTKSKGNNLDILKPGDKWCLCAKRWKQAKDYGLAPKVDMQATNIKTKDIIGDDIFSSNKEEMSEYARTLKNARQQGVKLRFPKSAIMANPNRFRHYTKKRINESDPKIGTGKKPKGSDRRLYTDENPNDTVSVRFRTKQDIIDTLNKESFKSKSHARQSQIINLIHQRLRVALERAKNFEVKKRLKTAFEYIATKKEQSKIKTQKMKEGLHDTSWENDEGDKITLIDLLNATEDLPVKRISVEELKPHLLTWDGDEEEIKKIEKADLQYPILIFIDSDGKFISIIDGHHRVQKAVRKGLKTIKAKLIPINSLPKDIRKVFSHMGRQEEMKEEELTEKCWTGYTQKGMKTMFGKRYPNCVKKTKK